MTPSISCLHEAAPIAGRQRQKKVVADFERLTSGMLFAAALLDRDSRAEEAESHKQDQLDKAKKGTNEWKHELASDSESAVR